MKNLIRSLILLFILLSVATYIIYIDSTSGALTRLSVQKIEIVDESIPTSMDGLSFVYISDIHAYTLDEAYYISVIDKINNLEPDFIFIGGDLLNNTDLSDDEVLKMIEWLDSLHAPLGKFAVLSDDDLNKEETIRAIYAQSNIEILENSVLDLHNKSIESIQLIGLNANLNQIGDVLNSIEPSKFNIVLSYDPDIYSDWKTQNIELFLGAKTHGGQVNLPLYGPLYSRASGEYIKGIYKTEKNQMFVSNGIGVSDLHARWLSDPAIYYFTLNNK
jgi:predicted MPP superfamily phosphohydrolase